MSTCLVSSPHHFCLPYQGMQLLSRKGSCTYCVSPVICDLCPGRLVGAEAGHGYPVFLCPTQGSRRREVLSEADVDIMLTNETLPGPSAKTHVCTGTHVILTGA